MGILDQIKLARKHSGYVRSLPPTAKKDLVEHDKECSGC